MLHHQVVILRIIVTFAGDVLFLDTAYTVLQVPGVPGSAYGRASVLFGHARMA
jgi:hypothetical protein